MVRNDYKPRGYFFKWSSVCDQRGAFSCVRHRLVALVFGYAASESIVKAVLPTTAVHAASLGLEI